MDQTIIRELNQTFKIHYPYEEISIYLQQSKLKDSPIPAFTDLFFMPATFRPTKISFRSCHFSENFPPDKTTSLMEFKNRHPEVSYQKLEQLYKKDLLAKYEWYEYFDPEKLSWVELLSMCNNLVERSATEHYMFLAFSLVNSETVELITN